MVLEILRDLCDDEVDEGDEGDEGDDEDDGTIPVS